MYGHEKTEEFMEIRGDNGKVNQGKYYTNGNVYVWDTVIMTYGQMNYMLMDVKVPQQFAIAAETWRYGNTINLIKISVASIKDYVSVLSEAITEATFRIFFQYMLYIRMKSFTSAMATKNRGSETR